MSTPELESLIAASVARVKAMTPKEREAMYSAQRESFARSGNFSAASDSQLINEYAYWVLKVKTTTQWGAALSAATEFRDEAEREIKRRGLSLEV